MHPDKLCDRISDAILDECLKQDPYTRAAIETMGGHGIVTITGELTTKAYVDMRAIAQSIVGNKYGVQINVVAQSPEIAQGVDVGGAGDQGIMVGYACRDNEFYMPQEVQLARSLNAFIYEKHPEDGKTQITLEHGKITSIVVSWCNLSARKIDKLVHEWMLSHPDHQEQSKDIEFHYNPAGDWNVGGFEADTGLTGRKLAVDNYGPRVPIGGGAFSGKDATKVDRSAAYAARQAAVDTLVHNEMFDEVYVYLAYAIGKTHPVMATAHGVAYNGKTVELELEPNLFTPHNIIKRLQLREPQFERLAQWGHMGTDNLWDQVK